MAAWAAAELERRGAQPIAIRAALETRTTRPRRVVVSEHGDVPSLRDVVAATAEMLLAAARRGDARAIDVAIVRHGGGAEVVALALGEALRVSEDAAELDRLIAGGVRVPLSPSPGALVGEDVGAVGDSGDAGDDSGDVVLVTPPEVGTSGAAARSPRDADGQRSAGRGGDGRDGRDGASGADDGSASDSRESGAGEEAPEVRAVRVHLGPGPAISHRAQPGETDAVLHRIAIHPAARRALILRELTIAVRGTLDDTLEIDFVSLVQDENGDGRRSGGDRVVGEPDAFVDDDGTLTWSGIDVPFGSQGRPLNLLVAVDFTDPAEGGTIAVTLPVEGLGVEEVASGFMTPVIGLPLRGRTVTLEGNTEPDLEQDRLDRLAAEGPDAIDESLRR